MTSPAEPSSIYEWAVPGNLQPEPIMLEVWRNLPEEFCREVELVNGQAVRCEPRALGARLERARTLER